MKRKGLSGLDGIRTGRAFALLAAIFVLSFGLMVVLVVLDQQRVLGRIHHLQEQTVPEIVRYQRLARNLEQLRQEGERVFAAPTPQARQDALFLVTVVASHPSVLEHPEAALLARETERFLNDVLHRAASDGEVLRHSHEAWQRLADRLSILVDDVSIEGISLANDNLNAVTGVIYGARYKLIAAFGLVWVFLGVFLFLLRRHLIKPLQAIDRALSSLSVERPAPVFRHSAMTEIHAVEAAIGTLHASLVQNEAARFALEELANQDGLTGLTNRRHFYVLANAELQRSQRYGRPVTVGMADLDHFKALNDTHGHAAGDAVLCSLAQLMRESFRQSDLICRYGGEEFAFLFPESTLNEVQKLAERLRSRCAEHDIVLPDGQVVRMTMSIGLADANGGTLETAFNRADNALYEAKRRGRNQVVLSPGLLDMLESGGIA